jgi:hypothetical protein
LYQTLIWSRTLRAKSRNFIPDALKTDNLKSMASRCT